MKADAQAWKKLCGRALDVWLGLVCKSPSDQREHAIARWIVYGVLPDGREGNVGELRRCLGFAPPDPVADVSSGGTRG